MGHDSSQLHVHNQPGSTLNLQVVLSSDTEKDGGCKPRPCPRTLSFYEEQLSPEQKDVVISTKCVYGTIVHHIRSWERTARLGYGFTEAEVCQLKSDNQNAKPDECAYKAYLKWAQNQGYCDPYRPLTAWTFLQVLHKAEEYDAMDALMKSLESANKSS